ncbi:MAG TPA: choice-of-anchor Q domain-containing protein, partial [Solirubrobacteraceae bacterium]
TEVTVADRHSVTLKSLTVDGGLAQADVVAGSGSLSVVNSTITGGVSTAAGAISLAPVNPARPAKLTVLRSTITNNIGLGGGAGAINVPNGSSNTVMNAVSVLDSTITANHGSPAGGIRLAFFDALTVRDSTITSNEGTGVWVPAAGTLVSPVALTNTIVAGNTSGGASPDCQDTQGVSGGGHNLIGVLDSNCPGIVNATNGNQGGTAATPLDPHLGPLASNGGPTQTRALLAGSPAINAGDSADCQAAPIGSTDQRGVKRNAAARLGCDVGAYDTSQPLETLYVKRTAASDPACGSASQANPFATIAGALACATDGSTIIVGTGTFAGGFTIAHNVVLLGGGAGTVIANPSAPSGSLTEVTVADRHYATLNRLTVNGGLAQADVVAGSGSLNVVNSTITGGAATAAGAISLTPGSGTANLTVLRSTIANNIGLGAGAGAINVPNGASNTARNTVSVLDSTITGNHGAPAGGIRLAFFDALTVRDSTITSNEGTGVWVPAAGTLVSPVSLTNSIVAENTSGSASPDCQDTQGVTGGGHNLIGVLDGNCPGVVSGSNGNQGGTAATPLDPRLSPLASNGGPTQTRALLAVSSAISAGDSADCKAAPISGTDQRGVKRNAAARLACDIGAYDTGGPH